MKLLTPEQVKSEKTKDDKERTERVRKLKEEEIALVSRINQLRTEEQTERERIGAETQKMRNEFAGEKCGLEVEILSLKEHRRDLMKPIDEIRKEADIRLKNATDKEADLARRENALATDRQILEERHEALEEREDALAEKSEALDRREVNLKAAEQENKRSAESLSAKWLEYHSAVSKSNAEIERREKEVQDARKVNDAVRESNEAESKRLVQERRALQDGYTALEQAKKHLGI